MRRQIIGVSFILGILFLLAACGSPTILEIIKDQYPLEDVVESSTNSSDTARIFIAKDKSLSKVSSFIQDKKKPNNASEVKDDKQILIYDEYFVTLTKDEENSDNTLIEVATTGFVRDNYNPGFFNGFFAYYILDNIFDVDDWGKRQSQRCIKAGGKCYKGYNTSGGAYKGPTIPSTFRGSGTRGGGPGAGK